MKDFLHHAALASPLFLLILAGWLLMRISGWPKAMSDQLTRFVFGAALPAMLFRMMSDLSSLPPVDARLLLAFFGGCLIVFGLGRLIAWQVFRLDGVGQSVFALGAIFSNNIMLGLPLAKVAFGDAALPSVALVLVFNALILWTLLSVSVEWARHGSLSPRGFAQTLRGVLTNPIIAGILLGSLYGLTGLKLPDIVDAPLQMLGQTAMPLALVALGMSLAEYNLREGWRLSLVITALKLVLLPVVVVALARLIGLPTMETRVIALLSSIGLGANVFLMSRQFKAIEGPIAGSLILSTILSALTTPLVLALTSPSP